MSIKSACFKLCMLALPAGLTSCGNKASDTVSGIITGPVLTGSSRSGAFISMVSPDSSVAATSLYYYNFGNGAISQVTTAEGRDPVVIWSASNTSAIFIVRSTRTFRVIKLEGEVPTDARSGTFPDLTTGDPTDSLHASSGDYLFANLHDKSLRTFESRSGYLSNKIDLSAADLSASGDQLSPIALASTANSYWLVSSGVEISGVSPTTLGNATALKLAKASDTWSVSDLDNSRSKSQGVTLTASHPNYGAATSSGEGIRFFGLCKVSFGAMCSPGADEINAVSGAKTRLSNFLNAPYEQYSWIIGGATDDLVYAHVTHTKSQQQMIVRANLSTGKFNEIFTLPDSSLSLLMYDREADRLLVGSKEGAMGVLNIFKAEILEAKVTTRDLPWHGAFVPTI